MRMADDAEEEMLRDVKSPRTRTLLQNKLDVARKRIAERMRDGDDGDTAWNDEMRKVAEAAVRLAPRRPAPAKQ